MTHDIIKIILNELNAIVSRVEINDLRDNTFYASLHVSGNDKTFVVDCRPSDAIAVAIRTGASIFVDHKVIEKSRKIENQQQSTDQMKEEKWTEILESLAPEDFGKYKM